ncbi:MAG: IclR family transcriptional regulator C-terminal domain-containing protein [Minwuia sp.]|nr:IclR family transcriptional regulator C-terminal domain-containing protein [Minwuia sp.]
MANRKGNIVGDGRTEGPPREVLLRGLSILENLNHRAVSSVEQLAGSTGLPKATVVRMLNMLVSAGYVQRLPYRRGYVLDESVLTLSSGYRSHDLIVQIAKPLLSAFTARTRWPLSLATLDRTMMRVRVGTLQESPFATETDMSRLARRLPMLSSALGLAYLGFCPDDERETLVTQLSALKRRTDAHMAAIRSLPGLVARIRAAGYAVSPPEADNAAVGLAVPVLQGNRVLACISLRYLARAMTVSEAASRHLEALHTMAGAIAEASFRNR